MDRAHQLPLGGERDFADAGQPLVERVGAETALAGRDEQRAFGRVALHGPPAIALLHGGVVRAIRGRERALELDPERAVDRSAALPLDPPVRRVSGALERDAPARGDDHPHRHLVLRQRAGLVGGDHAGRAERLDRGQVSDDGVPPRHALHADREHGGHDRRQTFRHRRDGERDAENQHVEDRRQAAHVFDEDDRRNHHDRNDHDDDAEDLAGAIELPLQRRGFVARLFQQAGDAAHLGPHPGRRHDGLAVPIGRRRAAEDHVVSIAERDVVGNRRGVLGDRQALAGQRGLGGLERGRFDQPPVGWNRVAFFDQDDVAGDDLRGGDAPSLAVRE